MKFLVTGSTLKSDNPRDLDLMGVMTSHEFKRHFDFTHAELQEAYKKTPHPPKLVHYLAECGGAKKILECLFDKRRVDFKFVPETIPYGDLREIELCDLRTLD